MIHLPEKELEALLALNRMGIDARRKTLESFKEGRMPRECLASFGVLGEEARKEFDPEKELALCWQKGLSLLTILDAVYPAPLKEISDPPLLLYMKGGIVEGDLDAVAVVGTRHPSFYGRTQAKRFAGELAAKGLTVVSGLARGVDQAAHEAALGISYGRTVAVLGSGLDVVYPKENEKLYRQIAERGAVLSEYSLGTPPLAENFPRRNRIISGLSLATFVVEAHSRSGSLITAHQALDQGKDVFALPGPVDQLTSRGTHQLLKEGAALVESPEDIFEALAPQLKRQVEVGELPKPRQPPGVVTEDKKDEEPMPPPLPRLQQGVATSVSLIPDNETTVIEEALREEGPLAGDEILDVTGLEPAVLPALLLKLELDGKVKRGADGKYSPA